MGRLFDRFPSGKIASRGVLSGQRGLEAFSKTSQGPTGCTTAVKSTRGLLCEHSVSSSRWQQCCSLIPQKPVEAAASRLSASRLSAKSRSADQYARSAVSQSPPAAVLQLQLAAKQHQVVARHAAAVMAHHAAQATDVQAAAVEQQLRRHQQPRRHQQLLMHLSHHPKQPLWHQNQPLHQKLHQPSNSVGNV